MEWIPCSERLPDYGKVVFGTFNFLRGTECILTRRVLECGCEYWECSGGLKPIAWMPLPEPYKGESNETV